MKSIKIPSDVAIRPTPDMLASNPNLKLEPLSFKQYAFSVWLDDARAVEGGFTKQCRWAKVVGKFEACEPGGTIELEDEDYEILKSIVERPSVGQRSTIAVQVIAFPQAVMDAETK